MIEIALQFPEIQPDGQGVSRLLWTEIRERAPMAEPWLSEVESLRFELSRSYRDHITHCAAMANLEWSRMTRLSFDTVIRDECGAPAVAYVQTVFKLLADCVRVDPADRHSNSYYACLMGLRFWRHQTGGGLVGLHSEAHELEDALERGRLSESSRQAYSRLIDYAYRWVDYDRGRLAWDGPGEEPERPVVSQDEFLAAAQQTRFGALISALGGDFSVLSQSLQRGVPPGDLRDLPGDFGLHPNPVPEPAPEPENYWTHLGDDDGDDD